MNKKKLCKTAVGLYEGFFHRVALWLEPFFALTLRIYIFNDFFRSGWLKVQDIYNGQWGRVVYLFKEEFKTPLLSPEIAAGMSTFIEVVFPTLLLLGLLSRFSALVIFFTALLIETTYMHYVDHYLWMTMSMYLVIRGAGCFSVDKFIHKKCSK